METLVVVAQHRNQYYGEGKAYKPARYGSSPSGHFRQINCRRCFQSGVGILRTPYYPDCTSPFKKSSSNATSSFTYSEKTPSPAKGAQVLRSSPIPINVHAKVIDFDDELGISGENSIFSERWAGPAYSNSPPPSSLPKPNFSVKPNRAVTLDLPISDTDSNVHSNAKSAPASPTSEYSASTRDLFHSVDSATMILRQILNLDLGEEDC